MLPSSHRSRTCPMWYLERIDPLPSLLGEKFISFVGAGGKTSLAEYLGRAAAASGKRVVMTTTTKIWATEPYVTFDDPGREKGVESGRFIRMGKSVERGKLTGLSAGEVEALGRDYDLVLVEADGAKGQPVEIPRGPRARNSTLLGPHGSGCGPRCARPRRSRKKCSGRSNSSGRRDYCPARRSRPRSS